jgi:hypothetical protein
VVIDGFSPEKKALLCGIGILYFRSESDTISVIYTYVYMWRTSGMEDEVNGKSV